MEANSKSYKLAKQYDVQEARRSKQEEEQQPDEGEAPAEAVAAEQDQAEAAAADEDAAAGEAIGVADAPPVAEAAAGDAAANGELAYKPSWARGGGGRGRTGGRFRGIDPIYPVEDPKILTVCMATKNGMCAPSAQSMSSPCDGAAVSSGMQHCSAAQVVLVLTCTLSWRVCTLRRMLILLSAWVVRRCW